MGAAAGAALRRRAAGPRHVRRRDPAQAARPPYSPFGIGYVFGTQDADEMFLAYTLPCVWDGKARDVVTTGYLVRDGVYGLLVDGERRCEFDPEHDWMRTIWLDAVDEHDRELSAVGELVSHHGEHGQGTGYFHWTWNGNGATARADTARTSRTRAEKCWKRCELRACGAPEKEQPMSNEREPSVSHQRRRRALDAEHGAYERYIDPDKRDMAIRVDHKVPTGIPVMSYNGQPARFTFENYQVVGSNEQLPTWGCKDSALRARAAMVIPGSLLTRLNPLKDARRRGPQGVRAAVPRRCRSSSTTRPTGSR